MVTDVWNSTTKKNLNQTNIRLPIGDLQAMKKHDHVLHAVPVGYGNALLLPGQRQLFIHMAKSQAVYNYSH